MSKYNHLVYPLLKASKKFYFGGQDITTLSSEGQQFALIYDADCPVKFTPYRAVVMGKRRDSWWLGRNIFSSLLWKDFFWVWSKSGFQPSLLLVLACIPTSAC